MRFAALLVLLVTHAVAAEVDLTFEPRWGGVAVTIPTPALPAAGGQVLRVTRLAALVSDVALARPDGTTLSLSGQFGLLDAETGRLSMSLAGVPPGDYVGIAFNLGLPSETNHANPGRWPAGHPLNPLVNKLHWNWQGGYVFLALEGHWGATDASGEPEGFSYHIAGDGHLIPVRFAAAFRIEKHTTISFALELSRVLGGRRLAADDGSASTHSAANDALAGQLAVACQHSLFWLGAASGVDAGPAPATTPLVTAAPGRPLAFKVPAGFPTPALPGDNPLTAEGVELGQALFNDVRLSGGGTQSCADCHRANRAFSDTVPLSLGADGRPGTRNAMPLFNLAWASSYAWDGSKPRIRDQAIAAMTNPVEMHGEPGRVVAALQADAAVAEKFRAAFGTPDVTLERIGLALEQCLLTNVSADAKFDRAMAGNATLTEEEKEGFALFMTEYDPARGRRGADCFHCHGGPLFTDYDFKNNGLDRLSLDPARPGVTGRAGDAGKFKTPSLRNVAVTAPYMHDGRFRTLEEAVAHYDHGVERSETLDPNLAKHPASGLNLTAAEQQALVAFLRTLTDQRWVGGN